jgi:transcriptional regulator with XRE-family HTH domain
MEFWKNTKLYIKSQNTTQEWVARQAGISLNTFKGWISKQIMPNADQAVAIAKALGTTVESLVGGSGRVTADFLISEPQVQYMPGRIREIVNDLQVLPDDQLQVVGLQINALAEAQRRAQASKTVG